MHELEKKGLKLKIRLNQNNIWRQLKETEVLYHRPLCTITKVPKSNYFTKVHEQVILALNFLLDLWTRMCFDNCHTSGAGNEDIFTPL